MTTPRHVLAVLLLGLGLPAIAADLSATSRSEIDQLLGALADSPCELHRGSTWVEGSAAAQQLREEHAQGQSSVASTEEFIARAGTGQIRCDGEEPQPSATWMKAQLTQIRKQPITDPNVYLGQ
jgi:hypothetical protein